MLKFLGLVTVVTIVMLVLGSAAPNIYAQYEGWKTYNNPNLKFAIEYPSYTESVAPTTNITETADEVHFDTYFLSVTIKAYPDSPIGPEQYAVEMQQTILEENPEYELVQSVETVLYNGELGYRFTVYIPSNGFYIDIIYFYSPNIDYNQYKVQFVGTNPVGGEPFYEIDEFMNTIRFFS
ncbi:hypothetical protein BH23THE1_BH23THE1_18090 [soil metagenome]